jgi:hypothetical protein
MFAGRLSKRFSAGSVTPSEFALWKPESEITRSYNTAVWYMGAVASSNVSTNGNSYRLSTDESTVLRSDARGLAALELAKHRLENLDFIGLTSRFDESVELLAWKLGIPLGRYCACNVNLLKPFAAHNADEILSVDARKAVLDANALDVELYAHAVQLFEADLTALRAATLRTRGGEPFGCLKSEATCQGPERRTNYKGSAKAKRPVGVASLFNEHEADIRSGRLKSSCSYECTRGINSSSISLSLAASSTRA